MKLKFDKDIIRHLINKAGISISRYKKSKHDELVSLEPEGICHGHALLGLIIDPFLLDDNDRISNKHTNHRESLEIAKIFLKLGYQIDVISKLRSTFIPKKKYTFYINLRTNFKNASRLLNDDCIKIVNLDTAHWSFSNYAAAQRVLDLQNRRQVSLASIRYITPNSAIEHCDYATMKGNDFTLGTYSFANKRIYKTNTPSHLKYESPLDKDFENCKRNFLWFGSSGFVHKGLDLVLEAFVDLPNYNLTVCGPIQEDEDFKKEYHKELFNTPNIVTKGWVDIESKEFADIINNSVAIVFPSCAEACNGGVITCMQAGIIPIVNQETGIDLETEFGILLKESSKEEIKEKVREISKLSAGNLSSMTRNAWSHVRTNHSVSAFHDNYKEAIVDIVQRENKKRSTKINLSI